MQEVQVLVTGFKAEYGQASGGVVNVVTRSGSNDLRGSGFLLFRDQSIMARSPYADRSLPADPFQRVHYGGWLGGPIKQNKLHYFLNYEREDRDTNSTSTRTLPTSNTQSLTVRYQLTDDTQPSGQSGTLLDLYVQVGQSLGDFYTSYPGLTNVSVTGGFDLGGPSNYPQGRAGEGLQERQFLRLELPRHLHVPVVGGVCLWHAKPVHAESGQFHAGAAESDRWPLPAG